MIGKSDEAQNSDLIRIIGYVEKTNTQLQKSQNNTSAHPTEPPPDLSTDSYDQDLKNLLNMSHDELDAELAELGFDEQKITTGIEYVTGGNVLIMPLERNETMPSNTEKLFSQDSLLRSLIEEAITK